MTISRAPDRVGSGAIPTPRAASAPRVSAFWLAYAAVAALAARDAADALDAMPMDEWLALSDDERAAIVAAYLAPSSAAPPPHLQRSGFEPARAQALLSAMQGSASLTAACRTLRIAPATVRRWIAERPDFAAQVAAARPPRRRA